MKQIALKGYVKNVPLKNNSANRRQQNGAVLLPRCNVQADASGMAPLETGGKMKIRIPKKIQTSNGEVEIPNIPARTAFERGLVEGWKAGYVEAVIAVKLGFEKAGFDTKGLMPVKFIEGEE